MVLYGYRLKKLPWGSDKIDNQYVYVKEQIKIEEEATEKGYTNFISGMALGYDIYFGRLFQN